MNRSYLVTGAFWLGAIERASRLFAAVMIMMLVGPNAVEGVGVDLLNVGWRDALSFAFGAAFLSLLFALGAGASKVGPVGSPSLVDDRPIRTVDDPPAKSDPDDASDVGIPPDTRVRRFGTP